MKTRPDSRRPAQPPLPAPSAPPYIAQRHDGWTAYRQLTFLDMLRVTRSVSRSVAAVGKSVASVYALRARPGGWQFAAAWDEILARPAPNAAHLAPPPFEAVQVLPDRIEPVFRMGRQVGVRRRPDVRRLMGRLKYLDRLDDAT